MVTPLAGRDAIDADGTRRLVEHLVGGGVAGLFVLGTTGEAPSLSYRLRRDFIDLVCRQVDERVPVLVGVTDTAFVETIRMAWVARDAGATAAVLSTPYYFPAGQTELLRYVEHVVEETPLPLMLYNIPSLTKVGFEIPSLKKLARLERIIGVKDSGGDLGYFEQLLELRSLRPDWSFLIGPEQLTVDAVRLGGDGGINGGANIYPELFVSLERAARRGDDALVDQGVAAVNDLQAIYSVGKYASRVIKATKCAVSLRGICSDQLAEPFNHFLPPERAKVDDILRRFEDRHASLLERVRSPQPLH